MLPAEQGSVNALPPYISNQAEPRSVHLVKTIFYYS